MRLLDYCTESPGLCATGEGILVGLLAGVVLIAGLVMVAAGCRALANLRNEYWRARVELDSTIWANTRQRVRDGTITEVEMEKYLDDLHHSLPEGWDVEAS